MMNDLIDNEFGGLNALKITNCGEERNDIQEPLYKELKTMGDFIPPKS